MEQLDDDPDDVCRQVDRLYEAVDAGWFELFNRILEAVRHDNLPDLPR